MLVRVGPLCDAYRLVPKSRLKAVQIRASIDVLVHQLDVVYRLGTKSRNTAAQIHTRFEMLVRQLYEACRLGASSRYAVDHWGKIRVSDSLN